MSDGGVELVDDVVEPFGDVVVEVVAAENTREGETASEDVADDAIVKIARDAIVVVALGPVPCSVFERALLGHVSDDDDGCGSVVGRGWAQTDLDRELGPVGATAT